MYTKIQKNNIPSVEFWREGAGEVEFYFEGSPPLRGFGGRK